MTTAALPDPPVDFAVRIDWRTRPIRVHVRGELDVATAGRLEAAVRDVVSSGFTAVLLDLSACTFLDAAGVAAVRRCGRTCRTSGGQLVLHAPSAAVARVLDLLSQDHALPSRPTQARALAGVQGDQSRLLSSLFSGVPDGERGHLAELLSTDHEESGARLDPRTRRSRASGEG